ncbi:MAG: oligoendopeptidase F [Erysipelotrichaceae bacterium]
MNFDVDTTNNKYQAYNAQVENLYTQVSSSFSFYKTELMSYDEALILKYLDEKEELKIYKHDFDVLFRKRAFILSDKEERLLAEASEVLSAPTRIFSMFNNADMIFPMVKDEEGQDVQLTHGRYGLFLESQNREVRKSAFMGMYKNYLDYKNTFAELLSTQVKSHNFNARMRGYKSARHAALSNNAIEEQVYDALIEAVHDRFDLLHAYVDLRKQVLKQDSIAMYDMYTALVEDVNLKITYDEAKELVLEGLSVLGEEYVSIVKRAFDERWIDVLENKGKRSGAYSSGSYATSPYILLNWQDNLDNVFTLAHELGHSMHSYYTHQSQPYVYGDYSIFLAEVASTTNEILMTDFLLKKYSDPKVKAYIINHYLDGFKGTVFRQTQFAEFEHHIHTVNQAGVALTADYLTDTYFKLNQSYYGDAIAYDQEIGYEWARIPHFYYNYYVFQYATGFSAASTLANRILSDKANIEPYLAFLKAGCSAYPIDVLKKAGVDMTSDLAVKEALSVFETRLNQLKQVV